jgi:hypothetical protein
MLKKYEYQDLSPRKQRVILNFVNLRSAARSHLTLTNLKVKTLCEMHVPARAPLHPQERFWNLRRPLADSN